MSRTRHTQNEYSSLSIIRLSQAAFLVTIATVLTLTEVFSIWQADRNVEGLDLLLYIEEDMF